MAKQQWLVSFGYRQHTSAEWNYMHEVASSPAAWVLENCDKDDGYDRVLTFAVQITAAEARKLKEML